MEISSSNLNKTGGPASPINESLEDGRGNFNVHYGLSIRDYFAAAALNGMMSLEVLDSDRVAKLAYEHADAMLKARLQP